MSANPRSRGSVPLCGDRKHKKAGCPYHKPVKVEVEVQEETQVEIEDVGKMTLLDRIALLDHPQWTPPVCPKCSEQQLCQGLAGPWYARRERGSVKARIQWFNGSKVQTRARAQARQKMRGIDVIASKRRRQD